jgi:uncharacterized protein YbcI
MKTPPGGYFGSVEEHKDPLSPPGDAERSQPLLGQISTQMVRAFKQYYGKGPTNAKSYFLDDLLIVVLRGGVLRAEQTMLDAGQEDTVRDFRQKFENEMAQRLVYLIEQLTERKVINFQSQMLFDPDMSIEIFVFDQEVDPKQRQETIKSLRDPEAGLAEAHDEDAEEST